MRRAGAAVAAAATLRADFRSDSVPSGMSVSNGLGWAAPTFLLVVGFEAISETDAVVSSTDFFAASKRSGC